MQLMTSWWGVVLNSVAEQLIAPFCGVVHESDRQLSRSIPHVTELFLTLFSNSTDYDPRLLRCSGLCLATGQLMTSWWWLVFDVLRQQFMPHVTTRMKTSPFLVLNLIALLLQYLDQKGSPAITRDLGFVVSFKGPPPSVVVLAFIILYK